MVALHSGISNFITFGRRSDHTSFFRIHFSSIGRYTKLIHLWCFLLISQCTEYTRNFLLWHIDISCHLYYPHITINFIQCYWMMYRITFKRNLWCFTRQLFSPIIVSLLIVTFLLPLQYILENMNIFVTLILKSFVSFIIFGAYIQLTHEYNILEKVRSILGKLNKQSNS